MDKYLKKESLILLIIFLIALALRIYNIKHTLLFHYDQGYHGLAIREIWDNKRLTLLGHKTDVQGIFHSSFFYYLMLPLYLISGWNPVGVSTILAGIDALSIMFIYLTAKKLFSKEVGLISALLYAVSYSVISYSRWLSNVTLIPFFSSIIFYLLALSGGKKVRYFSLALFIAGIVTQLNGAIGFFLLPILIIYLIYFKNGLIKKKLNLILYLGFFALPNIGLLLFDLRHDFLVTRSIVNLFTKSDSSWLTYAGFIRVTEILTNQFINLFSYRNTWLFIVIIITVLYCYAKTWKSTKQFNLRAKIILAGPIIYITGLFIYQRIHDFFIVPAIPLMTIVVGWSFYNLFQESRLKVIGALTLGALVFVNIYNWQGFLDPNFNLVPIGTRNLITLEDRINAVDFMYSKAQGEPFKTEIYIIPYYQEEPWNYVLKWYALPKYGYLPSDDAESAFLIYEPDYDYVYRLKTWLEEADIKYSKVKSVYKSNSLTVEERM